MPDSGRVLLDGADISCLSPAWFHRKVALVGQEPTLFARSLYDNICYGLEGEHKPHVDLPYIGTQCMYSVHGPGPSHI